MKDERKIERLWVYVRDILKIRNLGIKYELFEVYKIPNCSAKASVHKFEGG